MFSPQIVGIDHRCFAAEGLLQLLRHLLRVFRSQHDAALVRRDRPLPGAIYRAGFRAADPVKEATDAKELTQSPMRAATKTRSQPTSLMASSMALGPAQIGPVGRVVHEFTQKARQPGGL